MRIKEILESDNRKKLLIMILCSVILLTAFTVTYAYFTVTAPSTQVGVTVTSGTMRLTFSDGDVGEVVQNLLLGETSTPKDLVLENTGSLEASAVISWNELTNTFLEHSLTYTLTKKTSLGGTYEVISTGEVPRGSNITTDLYEELNMPAGAKYYYQLTITFNDLEDVDQTIDATATFKTSFTINGEETGDPIVPTDPVESTDPEPEVETSLMHLVNTQLQTAPSTYNMFNFTYNGYKNTSGTTSQDSSVQITEGLYETVDEDGPSYYFRGSSSLNNIVLFGSYSAETYSYPNKNAGTAEGDTAFKSVGVKGTCNSTATNKKTYCTSTYAIASAGSQMFWRILRINGDESVRLIYGGTYANGTYTNKNIGTMAFNTSFTNNGYTSNNSAANSGSGNSSDAKKYLQVWYNGLLTNMDQYVVNGKFYSDTRTYQTTYYEAGHRLNKNLETDVAPTLLRPNVTVTSGGPYTAKVGLVTADELILSGADGYPGAASYGSATTYPYAYANQGAFWTMTPFNTSGQLYVVGANKNLTTLAYSDETPGILPVINISKEAWLSMTGSGTSADPYKLP